MLASTVSSKFLGALAEVEGFQFEVSIPLHNTTLPLLINDIYHNVMLQSLVGIIHQSPVNLLCNAYYSSPFESVTAFLCIYKFMFTFRQ